ncbi:HAMP domain-containing sensor histidine kinase [Pelomonas sp. SE-A7]|uniref:sensor histidine kinase n=1 Tax=Pelomonas sp. SE-A7 TaxID=3054953 RepID=UPI00259CE6E9|nr:HAMP domain-containing sensor histidine kinase [Pelomonas sp. SE-A7]MDM4768178.1 HAMP domain-containing sensor histidine kinase [Pelomonas sp. SE-A7]
MLQLEFDQLLSEFDDSLDAVDTRRSHALAERLRGRAPDAAGRMRMALREMVLAVFTDQQPPSQEQANALLEQARRLGDTRALADALVAYGRVVSRLRMVTQALDALSQAEALYAELGDARSVVMAQVRASHCLYEGEMFDELLQRFEPLLGDPQRQVSLPPAMRHGLLNNVGAAYSFLDRYEDSERVARQLYLEACERPDYLPPSVLLRDTVNLANQLLWLGRLDEVEPLLDEAGRIVASGEVLERHQIFYFQNLALLAWKRGRHAEALEQFDQAKLLADRFPSMPILARILLRKAECAEEAGLLDLALQTRKAQVRLMQERVGHQARSFGKTLEQVMDYARAQGQNEYLRRQGSQLERELAEARDALELKVQERTRELEHATRMLLEREKQAALSHLVAGVAHELNTPLGNAILATSTLEAVAQQHRRAYEGERLSRRMVDEFHANLDDGLRLTQRSLERAAELVRSFKALALEQASAELVDFQVGDVVRNTLAVMEPGLRKAAVEAEPGAVSEQLLHGNPGALGQVLAQLIDNALVHGFEGWPGLRRLRLEGERDADHYLLRVADSGRGIASAHRARVFDPFFTTRLGQGSSGLGLHLVYRLVTQRLGGEIHLLESPGGGALFELRLPLR